MKGRIENENKYKNNFKYIIPLCGLSSFGCGAQFSSFPSPSGNAAVVTFQNKIYVISGKMNFDDRNDVFVYNPENDSWQTKTSMPETRFIRRSKKEAKFV